MYAAIWRALPGPVPVKVLLALALFAAVVFALFEWIFPWLAPRLPFNDVTVSTALDARVASSIMGS